MTDLDDHALLAAWASRHDDRAFATLMDRHLPRVHAVCRQRLQDPAEAEDAAQTTFLLLARKAPALVGRTWRQRSGIAAWLGATGARVSANAARARARRQRHEHRAGNGQDQAAEVPPCAATVDPAQLHRLLAQLPESYRLPLTRCYLEGHPRDVVATDLGLSLAALHKRLTRGMDLLRHAWRRTGSAGMGWPAALLGPRAPLGARILAQLPEPGRGWQVIALLQHPALAVTAAVLGAAVLVAWPRASSPAMTAPLAGAPVLLAPPAPPPGPDPFIDAVREACDRGTTALLRLQHADGTLSGPPGYAPIAITALGVEAFDLVARLPGQRAAAQAARDRALATLAQGLRLHHGVVADDSFAPTYAEAVVLTAFAAHAQAFPDGIALCAAGAQALVAAQSPVGGWRYHLRPEDEDASVTATVLRALLAVQAIGALDPQAAIARGQAYLVRCSTPSGGVAYSPQRSDPGSAYITALAALDLEQANHDLAPLAGSARTALASGTVEATGFPFLAAARSAAALASEPALAWRWAHASVPPLLASQHADGGWGEEPSGPSDGWSTACTVTALATLVTVPAPVVAPALPGPTSTPAASLVAWRAEPARPNP